VRISGDRARWELAKGTFPRSTAAVAIVDGPLVTLLDFQERLSASATPDDFSALFKGRPATEGAAAGAVKDVSVHLKPDGAGRSFEGRKTARFTLEASWTLVVSTPGRVNRVAVDVRGTIETVDEPGARSPFDDLSRLLPARGAAQDALAAELSHLGGLPVSVAVSVVSRASAEMPGMPSGTEPPPRPAETRQTITRRVSNLAVRRGGASDDTLFAIPDDFHARALDRIVPEGPP
jgi:hypothetical protein